MSIGITDNRDCLKRRILESFFSDLICSSVTGLLKELKYLENLLKNKKSTQNQADKLFKK